MTLTRVIYGALATLVLPGVLSLPALARAAEEVAPSEAAANTGVSDSEPAPVNADASAGVTPVVSIEERIASLEAEIAALKAATAPPEPDPCAEPAPDPCEPVITSGLYGNLYLQWRNRRTQLDPEGTDTFSDIDMYWGEIGINASSEDWSGKFSILLDDSDNVVKFNEGWVKYQHLDDCGALEPAFIQMGRILVPFGNNTYYFPTYPAVNDLGYSTLKAIGGGYDSPSTMFAVHAYNGSRDLVDSNDTISDYTATWDISKRAPTECQDGWEFTVGYNSNLAAHDLKLGGAQELHKRVPGANVFGRYDFNNGGGGLVHVLADYTWALEEYDPLDLDANADTFGDRPAALNTELVFEPQADTLWGVNYQLTDEMQDYAASRWGLLYGQRLNKIAKLKLEYTHGSFDEFATAGQDQEDTVVGEINFAF